MRNKNQNLGGSRARRWYAYLWHEWTVESRRPIAPAFARPNPAAWSGNRITAAWLGHAVLINFFGLFRDVSELRWKERKSVTTFAGKIDIVAFRVKHWGARTRRDTYRGYNGYVLERNNRRIIFGGGTAVSDSFADVRASGPIDLAIMPIGAYNPWIHSHCTPEQAVHMANEAGAHFIMPVHHQTFPPQLRRLSRTDRSFPGRAAGDTGTHRPPQNRRDIRAAVDADLSQSVDSPGH
jgi:Beta-lactamase superfamily domain